MADLFLGRPRSRRYPKFNIRRDIPSLTVYPGMTHMTESAFINVKNRSHTITAEVEIPRGGGEGVILAQGGRFAGWSLYMRVYADSCG